MANTLKFGNGEWYGKKDTILAYNDENNNYKPLPFDFSRASSATRVNKAGLIETVGSGQPRIDYKDDVKGALLLEPQRTNYLEYSEDFTFWTLNADSVVKTDDIQFGKNVWKLTESSSSNLGVYRLASSMIVGETTLSVLIKANTSSDLVLRFGSPDSKNVVFDLLNGTIVGQSTGSIGNIESYGNGWYLCSNTITTMASSATAAIYTDSGSVDIVYAQLEQGSYPTSYIPTQGSAVTRLADSCNNGGNEQVINSTEGVLYFETKGFINVPTFSRYIQLSKNGETGFNNSLVIQHRNNGFLRIYANGTDNSDVHFNIDIDFTQNHKIAVLYKLNGYKLFIDGVAQSLYLTPTQTVFSGLDTLSFDYRGTYEWNGSIKDVRVYNTALTDQELQALTQE